MVQHLEAVFEGGVLHPLQPLSLEERQHVLLTVTELPRTTVPDTSFDPSRTQEQEWIRVHGSEYRGQWVALQGSELISHGPKGRGVHDEALAKGVLRPLLVHLPDEPDLPSAGWL
jgi:predicted DNA-binding antitoxin AbrB/MazE fold protein